MEKNIDNTKFVQILQLRIFLSHENLTGLRKPAVTSAHVRPFEYVVHPEVQRNHSPPHIGNFFDNHFCDGVYIECILFLVFEKIALKICKILNPPLRPSASYDTKRVKNSIYSDKHCAIYR